jgi:nucleoside diphosphate kinase
VAKAGAVATGAAATEAEPPSPFASLDRPVLALVADPGIAMADFEGKLEEVVFKNEKVGLAMKAFRAVRISPDNAEKDPVLGGEGKTLPRILLVNPTKKDVVVLESEKIKAASLFKAMQKVADSFYEEKIEKVVKEHLRLLNDRDKLAGEEKNLRDKEARLAEEGEKSSKDLEEVRKEIADLGKELEKLAAEERDLWKLTRKDKPA